MLLLCYDIFIGYLEEKNENQSKENYSVFNVVVSI